MLHRFAPLAAFAALVAALGSPAPAAAAEGFVGVLGDGKIVRFQSDAPTGLSSPLTVRGLAPREVIVALAGAPGRVYAVGSSARLYLLNPRDGRARRIGAPFAQGLRGTRFSLAIAPDGVTGRLLSDVGQSVQVDLASGATLEAQPLRRASDQGQAFPAADFLPDGRLAGVDLARRELLTETGPGTSLLDARQLTVVRGEDLNEPSAFDVASDGQAWMLASFGGRRFRPQSILLKLDRDRAATDLPINPFLRRVVTFTALGNVPDDETAPRTRIVIPRALRLRDLFAGRLRFTILSNEGGQATGWVGLPGEPSAGPALSTRDVPGRHELRYFSIAQSERGRYRARVGRRIRVTVSVGDWAGNRTRVTKMVRLIR